MIELAWDAPFTRILKKWKKRHPDLTLNFHSRLKLFTEDLYHSSLKTHSLSGKLEEGKWGQTLKAEYTTILISLIKKSTYSITGEVIICLPRKS